MAPAHSAKTASRPPVAKPDAKPAARDKGTVSRKSRPKILPTVESSSTIPSIGEIGLAHFVPYLLNRISACWNVNLQEALKDLDMTTTKMRILAVLSVMPGLTINELAVHAITEQSTMSRTLDALEEQNYIRRQARADDMRVREIYITEDGRLLFARIWPPVYELYSHLFEGVDEAELRALIGTLHKILHNTRKYSL
jgi:MarR family transcriptional regulator for hemolysin